jgi:predicted MFS family arabinose efflux permease
MMIERKGYRERVLLLMMGLLAFSELGILIFLDHGYGLAFALWAFFTAFNTLEAGLPSLVSQFVLPQHKGTALGIYSSSQFLGLFLGGALGGWLDLQLGAIGVLLFCAILAIIWLVGFYIQMKRGLQWQEG